MTKLESIAVAILIIASGAYVINSISSSDDTAAEKVDSKTDTVLATPTKKAPVNQPLPTTREDTRVNHAALPVAHGYADASGKQINPETGQRLPPPPPLPAPNKRRAQSNAADQHGHESIHSSHKRGSDVPPPVGANG